MVFSKYPNQLDDSTSLPPSTDLVTPVKAEITNRLRDSILAIQQELSTQPSGVFGSVRARLDFIEAQLNTLGVTYKLKISNSDSTADYLEEKITAGSNITITKINTGANESIQIDSSGGLSLHASTHNDGGSDELTVQNLGSGAAVVDQIIVTDGLGGWTLASSITPSVHETSHNDGGLDELTAQDLGSGSAEDGYVMVTDSGGWILASSLTPSTHASSHDDGSSDELTVQNLGSGAAAIDQIIVTDGLGGWTLTSSVTPSAHASSHDDGSSDELTVQNLGSGAAAIDQIIVTDGLGGWTLTSSVTPSAHATSHNDGGLDELTAQNLGSGSAEDGYVMVTSSGGWVLGIAAGAAHATSHEAGESDELIAQNLSSDAAEDGYIMVADGLGGWRTETNAGGAKIIPGVSGYEDTAENDWQEIGAVSFNPSEYSGAITFEFEALIHTTVAEKSVSIQLYNLTDGSEVASSTQTSTSLIPELKSVALTVPGDLPNSQKIYTVRIKMSIAGGPNERAICKVAHIKIT